MFCTCSVCCQRTASTLLNSMPKSRCVFVYELKVKYLVSLLTLRASLSQKRVAKLFICDLCVSSCVSSGLDFTTCSCQQAANMLCQHCLCQVGCAHVWNNFLTTCKKFGENISYKVVLTTHTDPLQHVCNYIIIS